MQQENHTRQELEVEWKGITDHPELGGINKDHPVQLKPLPVGFLWNNLGNNLTPFGFKHRKYPLEIWHWEREKSRNQEGEIQLPFPFPHYRTGPKGLQTSPSSSP